MGIFSLESNQATPSVTSSLDERWRSYIRQETIRRLGWAIYKYDTSVAYLHNNRPFLSCGDMKLKLPGSDEHWQAETAEAWASLHPWSRNMPSTVQLRPLIRSLFDGTAISFEKIQEEDHLSIIVLTLLRKLWTLKENRSDPTIDLTVQSNYEHERLALLRTIDQMIAPIPNIPNTHTRPEMERLVHRTQLVHVAHLYGAGDLMNLIFPYLRDDAEAEQINIRMEQWANEDTKRTREVAFHSAQLIGLVRRYPSQMPLQSFIIFHAGVVLACMSTLLPQIDATSQGPSLQLDELGIIPTSGPSRHMDWIDNGGSDKPSLFGVPSLCCTTGRQQVLNQTASLLKRQRSWGMAHSLAKVVTSLSTRSVTKKRKRRIF
jgi:hypothetical protein